LLLYHQIDSTGFLSEANFGKILLNFSLIPGPPALVRITTLFDFGISISEKANP